jgi:chromosome condensin MukBEF complex kleisin-like MukF subunit
MIRPNDLEWLAARLSIAVYDTNRLTPEMSVLELKDALHDIPGVEDLTS